MTGGLAISAGSRPCRSVTRVGGRLLPTSASTPAKVVITSVGAAHKLIASKGGKARAEKLTPEQRSAIAKRAAQARWLKEKQRPHRAR